MLAAYALHFGTDYTRFAYYYVIPPVLALSGAVAMLIASPNIGSLFSVVNTPAVAHRLLARLPS